MSLTPRQEKIRDYIVDVVGDLLARDAFRSVTSFSAAVDLVEREVLAVIGADIREAALYVVAALARGGVGRILDGAPKIATRYLSGLLDDIFGDRGKPKRAAEKRSRDAKQAGRAMMELARTMEKDRA